MQEFSKTLGDLPVKVSEMADTSGLISAFELAFNTSCDSSKVA